MARKKRQTQTILALGILLAAVLAILYSIKKKDVGQFNWQSRSHLGKSARTREIPLCENLQCERWITLRSRTIITVSAYAKAKPDRHSQLNNAIRRHAGEIKDKIRSVVTAAEHSQLYDPTLEHVTREISASMEEIVGKNLFNKILIPTWHIDRS